jgi:hypothetical protein
VEPDEEPVEAQQDDRHGERGDRERRKGAGEEPRRHRGAESRPQEHEREHGDRERGDELRPQSRAEEAAHVAHVRQLALAERRRAVGQGGPLEEDDPLGAGLDGAEPELRERGPLRRIQAVRVARKPVAAELPLDERVRCEHPEAGQDEDRGHGERDEHGHHPHRDPRPGGRAGQRYSPNSRPISRHVVVASATKATTSRSRTTQNRAPAIRLRRRCAIRAARRARWVR